MSPASFEYRAPESLGELLALLSKHREGARLLAGGQGLVPALRRREARPAVVIDLRRIRGLESLEPSEEGVRIGALATYRDLEESSLIHARCPLLSQAALLVGDEAVRGAGTLVGSVCQADPGADMAAPLLVLHAGVEVTGPRGPRTVRIEDFLQGAGETALEPDEFVLSIRIPRCQPPGAAYRRMRRGPSGFALAGVAVLMTTAEGRVADALVGVTGVASRPFRALAAEEALRGREVTPEEIRTAVQGLSLGHEMIEDAHGSSEYRSHMCEVLMARAILAASGVSPG